jgi:hypothetical protein
MSRDDEIRLAAEGDPVRSTPRWWAGRSGGLAGIAFVLLIVASWFADTTGFKDSDQTAGVITRDLANRVGGLETSIGLVGLAAVAGFWFVGSLHLRLTGQGPSTAAWAAFGGGVGGGWAGHGRVPITGADAARRLGVSHQRMYQIVRQLHRARDRACPSAGIWMPQLDAADQNGWSRSISAEAQTAIRGFVKSDGF